MASWLGLASGLLAFALPAAAVRPVPLDVFGYGPAALFQIQNLSFASWLAMILLPRWSKMRHMVLAQTAITAVVYAIALAHVVAHPMPGVALDFTSLAAVTKLFTQPEGVLAGWLHYCVTDPLMGLGELLDAQRKRVPHLLLVPCLVLTCLGAPAGLLLYLVVRTVWLAWANRPPKDVRSLLLKAR